jgi:hypothetical protein
VLAGATLAAGDEPPRADILEVRRIWDGAPHNAFTDLIRWRGAWWCCFREAEDHVGGDGRLRVLESRDAREWASAALLAEEGIDLRDPKLSITPDGRLMMVAGGSVYAGTRQLKGRQPRVAFSADGRRWTPTRRVLAEGDWLWRVTWHRGRAYGVSYTTDGTPDGGGVTLYCSRDGLEWEALTPLEVPGRPNETTLRFLEGGEMMAVVRREGGTRNAWIGTSRAPYRHWQWREASHRVGGPNFIALPDGRLWLAGRAYPGGAKTVLARLTRDDYDPLLTLPSGGDTSYPGLVWHRGLLWMSYYSSHEGKASIYLARIRLPAP